MIRVCLTVLVIWLFLDIFLTSVVLTDRQYNFRFDYISILAGFILTLLARWYALRDQTRVAGYLLGGIFFFRLNFSWSRGCICSRCWSRVRLPGAWPDSSSLP
jgi:uncharacterized membrane protein YciS (DUF1049 family)